MTNVNRKLKRISVSFALRPVRKETFYEKNKATLNEKPPKVKGKCTPFAVALDFRIKI